MHPVKFLCETSEYSSDKIRWFEDHTAICIPFILEFLECDLDAHQIAMQFRHSVISIPSFRSWTPSLQQTIRFYKTDIALALLNLVGKYCIYCASSLNMNQDLYCSRGCVSRFNQHCDDDISLDVVMDLSVFASLHHIAKATNRDFRGYVAGLLKKQASLEQKFYETDLKDYRSKIRGSKETA